MGCCESSSDTLCSSGSLRDGPKNTDINDFEVASATHVKENERLWANFVSDLDVFEEFRASLQTLELLPDVLNQKVLEWIADEEGLWFGVLARRMERCTSFSWLEREQFSNENPRLDCAYLPPTLWTDQKRCSFCLWHQTLGNYPCKVEYDPDASPPYLLSSKGVYVFPGPNGWYKLKTSGNSGVIQASCYASLRELVQELGKEAKQLGLSDPGLEGLLVSQSQIADRSEIRIRWKVVSVASAAGE